MPGSISGADAIAAGVLESGVSLVTGYPGSPATKVVDAIQASDSRDQVKVIWNANEKTAVEMAFGTSLAGSRSLLCVKSVGFNITLDPLMTINLADCNAGFVILVGDDPGGWSSQNEQDSRAVALATGLPILEPVTVHEAHDMIPYAYHLSEEIKLPVIVRVTKPLIYSKASWDNSKGATTDQVHPKRAGKMKIDGYDQDWINTVILPVNVVKNHQQLQQKLEIIQTRFERSPFNSVEGAGRKGVLVSGYVYQKLLDMLKGELPPQLRVARLSTFYPLPEKLIKNFLLSVDAVLIIEEGEPLLENALTAFAKRSGLTLPIFGRHTKDIPLAGELEPSDLANALSLLLPDFIKSAQPKTNRAMPSKQFYPPNCPYIPIFDTLLKVVAELGPRQDTIIVGDPGCMVRGQNHYNLLDIKTSLGASIGIAAGIAIDLARRNEPKRVLALSGDSGFFHSNFQGLMDAVQIGAQALILVLDNNITALSGGQPHPGTRRRDPYDLQTPIEIGGLATQAGVKMVKIVDIDQNEDLRPAILAGLETAGVSLIIARGECPDCPESK